jgi:glycine cleavage system H protein
MTSLLDGTFFWVTVVAGVAARVLIAFVLLAAVALPVVALAEAWPRAQALVRRLRGLMTVEGLDWRRHDYYAPSHTWLRRRALGGVRVGLDGLAAQLVPWVRATVLPRPGDVVRRGDVVAELKWGDRRAPILAPLDGTVSRVNRRVAQDPSLALRDPYGRGWLFTVVPTGSWRRGLREGLVAREWFALEARHLARVFEQELGIAAADGGHLLAPRPGIVDDEHWRTLSRTFLRAA